MKYFLGMEIRRESTAISVSQSKYARESVNETGVTANYVTPHTDQTSSLTQLEIADQ